MRLYAFFGLFLVMQGSSFSAEWSHARAKWLVAEIARHDQLYYKRGRPEISDDEYDLLREELLGLEGNAEEGSRFPIRSLQKAKSKADLRKFYRSVLDAAGGHSANLVIEPKVDGVAVTLSYRDGHLIAARTRGNRSEGRDVLSRVLLISDIPKNIPAPPGSLLEMRGEIYLSKVGFERVNNIRKTKQLEPYAIPRSGASGLFSKHEITPEELACLQTVFFGSGDWTGHPEPPSYQEMIRQYRDWGFPVLADHEFADSWSSLVAATENPRQRLANLAYPSDGLVIKVDSTALQKELGESQNIPNWAIARKYPSGHAETYIRKIVSEVGPTGRITPVAEFVSVEIDGRKVRRASLHSFSHMRELDVREGDWVEVELAGDVIPSIKSVLLERRREDSIPMALPEICPQCGTEVAASQSGRILYCPNLSCKEP